MKQNVQPGNNFFPVSLCNWLKKEREALTFILSGWAFSKIILVLTAWFTNYFPKNASYQRYIDQGFQFTPIFPIDIWSRWDTQWYLSIAKYGYLPIENFTETYSNLAFFPLYPVLVRFLTFWLPQPLRKDSVILLVGLVLSNLFFLMALWGIFLLGKRKFGHETGIRASLLTLALPGAFFFSAFYTESLFLFLIIFAFLSANEEKWFLAILFSTFAALTRAHGILILLPLLWTYLSKKSWNLRKIRPDAGWFLLPPLAVFAHLFYLYRITGEPLAFFKAQSVWGRSLGSDFGAEFFSQLSDAANQVAVLDLFFISSAMIISCWMLLRYHDKSFGTYALISSVVLLNSGRLFSMTRYTAVIFPITLFLADRIKNKIVFAGICLIFTALQILMYAGWVNYYWIA